MYLPTYRHIYIHTLKKHKQFLSPYPNAYLHSNLSWSPKSPARPMPEESMPPKGALRMNSQCLFTQTVPACPCRPNAIGLGDVGDVGDGVEKKNMNERNKKNSEKS